MKFEEHYKLLGSKREQDSVCEFLEFLAGKGIVIKNQDRLIAEFFNIDFNKFSQEKEEINRILAERDKA